MRFVVIKTATNEIVSSYNGECMSNVVQSPVKSRRIKDIVDGKPVWEEIERPHFSTAFTNNTDYSHVLVPPEYESVNTEDLIMNGDVVTVTAAYLEMIETEKWNVVRKERNGRLTATDWTMLRDVPHSLVWEEYRQTLRDLPASFDKADDVVYPSPP